MSWKQTLARFIADALRLSITVCLFIDGILIALFSIWFVAKFLYQTMNWLSETLFNHPW